tara:strand:+ start:1203 stop:1781 length:579 start_codon:yes stop_codon:yes gene_type:complete
MVIKFNESYLGLEKEICDEIRDWSAYALEEKSPDFNGFSPCPYAKNTWEDHKVSIVFKYSASYQPLYNLISLFDDTSDLVLLVDLKYPDSDYFHTHLFELNDAIADGDFGDKDLWLMGFHPEDEANELIDDGTFEPHVETSYAMIFIQRLAKLHEASEKLASLGYYDRYTGNYDISSIREKRSELYGRLKNG